MSVRGHESRPAGPGSAGAPLPARRGGRGRHTRRGATRMAGSPGARKHRRCL